MHLGVWRYLILALIEYRVRFYGPGVLSSIGIGIPGSHRRFGYGV